MNARSATLVTALSLLPLFPATSSAQGALPQDYAGPNYICTGNRQSQASKETIIRTIRLTEMQAEGGAFCARQCTETPNCRGFNLVHRPPGNYCQLLAVLPKTYPFPGQLNVQFGAVCMRRSVVRTPGDTEVTYPGPDWRTFQETRPGAASPGKK